jgi:ubiquinone/menaquinone biosynthesis C-methylase UbiE
VPLQKMVDVGGGNGKRSKKIAGSIHALSLTIIDNSEGMIALANNTKELKITLADISDKNFLKKIDGNFDVIINCAAKTEHFGEKKEFYMTFFSN